MKEWDRDRENLIGLDKQKGEAKPNVQLFFSWSKDSVRKQMKIFINQLMTQKLLTAWQQVTYNVMPI